MEWLLGAAVLYHALNGLRIVVMDFWPPLTRFHRGMWYLVWVVFIAVGLPVTLRHLRPVRAGDGLGGMSARYGRTGRAKPASGGWEVAIWYLMRVTGLGLFVLVLSHYLILHVLYDPAQQHSGWIAEMRW